jgi:hypothetical protein
MRALCAAYSVLFDNADDNNTLFSESTNYDAPHYAILSPP